MNHRLTILLTAAILTFVGFVAPISAQEQSAEEQSQYNVEANVGIETGVEAVASTSQDESVAATAPDLKKLHQQKKAERLGERDPFGGALTIISMVIVVLALAVLSILFLIFGRISSTLQRRRKQKSGAVPSSKIAKSVSDADEVDSGEVIAAIVAAMSEHYSGKHDMEDYILTIRSMKRSYSPWNSKIYNLRILPQVNHN